MSKDETFMNNRYKFDVTNPLVSDMLNQKYVKKMAQEAEDRVTDDYIFVINKNLKRPTEKVMSSL